MATMYRQYGYQLGNVFCGEKLAPILVWLAYKCSEPLTYFIMQFLAQYCLLLCSDEQNMGISFGKFPAAYLTNFDPFLDSSKFPIP